MVDVQYRIVLFIPLPPRLVSHFLGIGKLRTNLQASEKSQKLLMDPYQSTVPVEL